MLAVFALIILAFMYFCMPGDMVDTTALQDLTQEHVEEIQENENRIKDLERYRIEQEARMDVIQKRVRKLTAELRRKKISWRRAPMGMNCQIVLRILRRI